LGYRQVWLPGHAHPYWLVVSEVYGIHQRWMLLTNVPVTSVEHAKEIWYNYRRRWGVESTFRFLHREGLRWEDFKALDPEAIQRLINLVLIAAIFLLDQHLLPDETPCHILLMLGGKRGLKSERDGPYLVLRGWQKILICINTLAVPKRHGKLALLLETLDAL